MLFLSLFMAIFPISHCNKEPNEKKILAERGVIDLSNVNFDEIETVNLDGEWDFYWKNFYSYEDITQKKIIPDLYFNLPGVWNGLQVKEEKLTGNGYCTLHLLVKLSPSQNSLALRIPIIETANKVWVNEKLIYEAGKIGKTEEEMIAYNLRAIKPIILNGAKEFRLTVQVANFMSRTGGVPGIFLLGKMEKLYKQKNIDLTFDMIVLGSLLIISVYHLGLFLIREKDKSPLYFGIFCFNFAIRVLVTDERVLLTAFPSLPFNVTNRIEFLTAYLMFPLFVSFLHSLFQNKMNRSYLKIVWLFTICLAIGSILLPHRVYTDFLFAYEIVVLISIPYLLYINFKAIQSKMDGALVSVFGMGMLAFGSIIDILQAENILYGHYTFPFSLFGFLFFQSFSLSIKFSKAFNTAENLTTELMEQKILLAKTNTELTELQKGLEVKVKERENALDEIHKKNLLEIQKVSSLEKELAIQKERQDIFTDIHDHMGSNLLDIKRIFNNFIPGKFVSNEDLEKTKLYLNKLEDNLRLKLYSIEDLEIFKKDPINGIRLLILRRYSIYDRDINFFCDSNLFELSVNGLTPDLPETLFSISQENANNDLKYGYGRSQWKFFIYKESICLEIITWTNYADEKSDVGNGKKNIILRLKGSNARMLQCIEKGKFHIRYYFPF